MKLISAMSFLLNKKIARVVSLGFLGILEDNIKILRNTTLTLSLELFNIFLI
jgi:hypothetical protein